MSSALYYVLKAATEIAPKTHRSPRYCGIHIKRDRHQLLVEATNGEILMRVCMSTPEEYFRIADGVDVIIPTNEVVKVLPKYKQSVTFPLVIKDCIGKQVEAYFDEQKINLIDDVFVDTSRIINKANEEPDNTPTAALSMKLLSKITKASITIGKAMGKIGNELAPLTIKTGTGLNPTSFRYESNGLNVIFLQSPISMK